MDRFLPRAGAMGASDVCPLHPAARLRARCGDCGDGMCDACFEQAAWPWKVCPACQAKREAAPAAVVAAPPPTAAPAVAAAPPAPRSGSVLPASRAPARPDDDEEEIPRLKRGSFLRVFLFLAAVTAIPLVVWLVALAVQGAYEVGIRPSGFGTGGSLGRVTASLCRGTGSGATECLAYNLAGFVVAATPWAVLTGPALVAAITVASWIAGRSRVLLLLLFLPGAYLTLAVLTALVALQGAVVLAVLFAVSFVTGGIVPYLVIGVGLAALFGVIGLIQATLRSVRPVTGGAFGVPVAPEREPRLWAEVRALADRLPAKPPTNLVLGIQPGFWVTEAKVHAVGGDLKGRTMYLSLAECRVLSRDELCGILGHEMAHYKGFDTRLSHFFYPVYAGIGASLATMEAWTDDSWLGWLSMAPARVVLEFFYWRFAAAENTIGRRRELAADKLGAEATSPRTYAAMLVKIHAFDQFWTTARGLMRGAFSRGQPLANASLSYAEIVRRETTPALLEGLGEDRIPHPTDSHPTLDVRLRALGFTIHDVAADALNATPADPAIGLLDDAEEIEQALSAMVPERMVY